MWNSVDTKNETPVNPNFDNQNQWQPWELTAQAWLSTLPDGKIISPDDIEAWIQSNQAELPDHVKSMPRPQLHQRFASLYSAVQRTAEENDVNQGDHTQARFQRTDQWLPVYTWLESIEDTEEAVKSKDILDWLSANPDVRDDLFSRHSRYHLVHYIKKCHQKILKRKEKKKGLHITDKSNTDLVLKSEEKSTPGPLACSTMNNIPTDSDTYIAKRTEALRKYEILVDLEKQLSSLFPKPQLIRK